MTIVPKLIYGINVILVKSQICGTQQADSKIYMEVGRAKDGQRTLEDEGRGQGVCSVRHQDSHRAVVMMSVWYGSRHRQ